MTAKLPEKIAAGADGAIALAWTTDRVQGGLRGAVVVDTNDPRARSVTLVLAGTVHAPIDIEPVPAAFLSAFRGEDVRRELTLRSNQPGPVTMRLDSAAGAHYVADLATVEPGKIWRLTVKPAYTSATSGSTACPPVTIMANGHPVTTTPRFTVTSSWLRKFIIQVNDPVAECANYDPADPTSIFWQCIDPSTVDRRTGTGLPRVWRYPFDRFRLAAHPDLLTHGFIGGRAFEHAIDMVGRRCRLQPVPPGETACAP